MSGLKQEATKVFEELSESQLKEFLTQFAPEEALFELYPRLLRFNGSGNPEVFEFNPKSLEFERSLSEKKMVMGTLIESDKEDIKETRKISYTPYASYTSYIINI